jgi:hypothetical protein
MDPAARRVDSHANSMMMSLWKLVENRRPRHARFSKAFADLAKTRSAKADPQCRQLPQDTPARVMLAAGITHPA